MAGKQLKLNSKVAASSILETVVAMVIIVVVFSTAMVILANVLKNSSSITPVRAGAILQEQLQKTESTTAPANFTYSAGDLKITQEITILSEQPALVRIKLTAFNGNSKKVAELMKIISVNEN